MDSSASLKRGGLYCRRGTAKYYNTTVRLSLTAETERFAQSLSRARAQTRLSVMGPRGQVTLGDQRQQNLQAQAESPHNGCVHVPPWEWETNENLPSGVLICKLRGRAGMACHAQLAGELSMHVTTPLAKMAAPTNRARPDPVCKQGMGAEKVPTVRSLA